MNNSYTIISSEFPPGPGGIGKHAYDMAIALSNTKKRVYVLTPQDYAKKIEIEKFNKSQKGISIIQIQRIGIFKIFKRINKVIKELKKNNSEIIILTGKSSILLSSIIKVLHPKTKLYGIIHGSEVKAKNLFDNILFNFSLSILNRVICVSRFTKNLIKNNSRIEIVPNGILIEELKSNMNANDEELKWQGYPKLLTVGRISKRKGQHNVVIALNEIKKRYKNTKYFMCGIDNEKETLIKIANEENVLNSCHIIGLVKKRSELIKSFKTCDIFIMLSENQNDGDVEGFGIAILEANYFGKPAIGSKGCGIEDAIIDGYNGILVDPKNKIEISNAVNKIINNYSKFCKNAIKHAENHDWNILIKKLLL